MEKRSKKKVILGMSGGVDSCTASYLLKEQGYDVIGVHIQVWKNNPHTRKDFSQAIKDAQATADILNIPLIVFNMERDFQKYVIEYFVKEYESGRTPNPCVACNRYVKFASLLKKAKEMGIEYIATGHYARVEQKDGRYLLRKAKDESKDQSYVLYNLTQEQLSKTLFPLGMCRKEEVREIAKKVELDIASKPDSQEICFIDDNDHYRFIRDYTNREPSRGEFVDTQGNVLGYHEGITKYTIGQRRGLGISTGKPLFVLDIDIENNRVILGDNDNLFTKEIYAEKLNWISIKELTTPLKVKAKIRYKAKEASATVENIGNGKVKVVFNKKQRAATSGQSVVFYNRDYVVGGGIITTI